MMDAKELATLEYEALQAEKRDKINARLQVWSLFIGLVGAFGLASIQAGVTGFVVALYPFLAYCIAGYTSHSESVLDQVKKYLQHFETTNQYDGYECFNQMHRKQRKSGDIYTPCVMRLLSPRGLQRWWWSSKCFRRFLCSQRLLSPA